MDGPYEVTNDQANAYKYAHVPQVMYETPNVTYFTSAWCWDQALHMCNV